MQDELNEIKSSLNTWAVSLNSVLSINTNEEVEKLLLESKRVECACDQLIYKLYEALESLPTPNQS